MKLTYTRVWHHDPAPEVLTRKDAVKIAGRFLTRTSFADHEHLASKTGKPQKIPMTFYDLVITPE